MTEKTTFSFGQNWQYFLKSLTEDSIKNAELSLIGFLHVEDLQGKSFLDIGCGSGLFSYAAFKLGAKKVVSFDADPFSIGCCNYLHKKANSPENWDIYEGSVLDQNFIVQLGKFDIVYSWGVLHHTGNMWEAIKNSARLVDKGGYYYIAIYNKVQGKRGSEFWLKRKKLYNQSPKIVKYGLELHHICLYHIIVPLVRGKNFIKAIKNYDSRRGMNWRRDITDWLGGYPYEFATVEEIFTFMKTNFPDFKLVNIKTTNTVGNNWYLFQLTSD
jgi:SAM-dependent methyltransferase